MQCKLSLECEGCPTRRVCLAGRLGADEIGGLSGVLTSSLPIASHEYVYRSGDDSRDYFYVRSGVFKTYSVNPDGEEQITGFYFPGEMMGCARRERVYADSAVALETGTVCALPTNHLDKLCALGLEQAFLDLLGEREAQAARYQRNLNQPRADARFAGWLIQVSERIAKLGWSPSHVPTPMSRTDLAGYLGMSLESLSRVYARFQKAGLIEANRKHVDLVNAETITRLGAHAVL